jgi:hypothetical protein
MSDDSIAHNLDDQTADAIIADCDGDPREAVIELLAIIRSLIHENQALREAASPGFARKRRLSLANINHERRQPSDRSGGPETICKTGQLGIWPLLHGTPRRWPGRGCFV